MFSGNFRLLSQPRLITAILFSPLFSRNHPTSLMSKILFSFHYSGSACH